MSEKAATVCCTLATNQPLACSLSNLSTPEVISMYHQCLFHIHMYQCIQQTVPFVQIPLLQTRKNPRLILGTHTPKVMLAPPPCYICTYGRSSRDLRLDLDLEVVRGRGLTQVTGTR